MYSKGGHNMKNFQQSAFSLEITSRNNEERITWDNCRALSEHRSEILERASQLGALVGPTNAHISVPTREMLHELARYVESLIY